MFKASASTQSLARRGSLLVLGCLAPLALAACGGDDEEQANVDQLDAQLTGDPAVEGEMDEQILIDPDLARATGDYSNGDGSAVDLSSMRLQSAGKPTTMRDDELATTCDDKAKCDGELERGIAWAGRMPKAFPVFPNAKVEGAAGVNDGKNNIRGVRFITRNAMQQVADYYYTRAKKAGYTAEYVVNGDRHILGGTREADDAAYVIMLSARDGGGTVAEITASQGR